MATAPRAKKRGRGRPRRDELLLDAVVFGLQAIKDRDGVAPISLIKLMAEKLGLSERTIRRRLHPPVDPTLMVA